MSARAEQNGLEIAVIGMACHLPGAASVEAFLENLRQGVESISVFETSELLEAGVSPALLDHPSYVKAGGVLEDIESFDAAYFGYTPREAELIDPQQRLFLERAAEALERAGHDPERFPGSIGVYAGLTASSYAPFLLGHPQLRGSVDGFQISVANDRDFLASRVAYKLNLQGPTLVVQTACSTSLAAVHVACQALLAGDCDMALAGGVSVRVPHRAGYLFQEEGIVSPDGHCRSFDSRARGTVPGNGVGVVVLRRLADALAAGDVVEAVIRGSAINNDGAARLGFTAPRIEGQAQVIKSALAMAEVDPRSIGYVEAHGTATALGDPVEIAALNQAFGEAPRPPCALGSVKSNFGHLDAAAGVAGLMKAILSLRHRQLFPSLHFEQANPRADFDRGPFRVNVALRDWPAPEGPRRAGVSSFGMGGTNVHVVLEEPPEVPAREPSPGPQLLVLSARSEPALARLGADLARHLRANPALDLGDVALTLAVGRRRLQHRAALAADSPQDAAAVLEGKEGARLRVGPAPEAAPPVAFLFTGQGAQFPGMARGLYAAESLFRRELDACCERLRPALGFDLRDLLCGPSDPGAAARLQDTAVAQPALFAFEYALARLWMSLGVEPQALMGHSVGEYVAACLAGVLDRDDALGLVAERGRLMAAVPPGAMLAVLLAEDRLSPGLEDGLSLAAVNGAEACVVAGRVEAIERWQALWSEAGVACRRLHTSHAFHSSDMDPVLAPFREHVARLSLEAPRLPFVSNVSGTWITREEATNPGYWSGQLRATVRFERGLAELWKEPGRVLLEVGPGDTLAALARATAAGRISRVLASLPTRAEPALAARTLLDAAARLWALGVPVDPSGGRDLRLRRRVALPTYPFERRRYWIDPPPRDRPAAARSAGRSQDPAEWLYVPSWRRRPLLAPPRMGAEPVLVLGEPRGPAASLAESLRKHGTPTELHALGSIDATWERLLDFSRRAPAGGRIVFVPGAADDVREFERSLFALFGLAKAIGSLDRPPSSLLVVTSGGHDVTGLENLSPFASALLAATRALGLEQLSLKCRAVDVEAEPGGGWTADGVEALRREVSSDVDDRDVAWRGPHRWEPAFEPVRLAGRLAADVRLRERGVYLITGGLGGIGRALANHLAEAHRARLVLVSRSAKSADLSELTRLEERGAQVWVAAADVTDPVRMTEVVEEAERRFGPIQGVVHAAGLPGAGLVELAGREAMAAVLAPKVAGTLVLDEIFRERSLDFMMLCSSLTGVLGAVGQADYAAGNAFLDAFAQKASAARPGRLTVAVAWDTWREAGMALNATLPRALDESRRDLLRHGLTHAEGVEVFHRILGASLPRVLVSTLSLSERAAEFARPRDGMRIPGPEAATPRHPRPRLQNDYVAPRTELERALADGWQRVLGIDGIGVHDNFFELGGESLSALRLVAILKQQAQVSISLVRLYELPTIALLARHLEGAGGEDAVVEGSGRRGDARAAALAQRRRERRLETVPEGGPRE